MADVVAVLEREPDHGEDVHRIVIAELLKRREITRLIVVDDDVDEVERRRGLREVNAAMGGISEEMLWLATRKPDLKLTSASGELISLPRLRQRLDSSWIDLDDEERAKLIAAAGSGVSDPREQLGLGKIRNLLPDSVEYLLLSVSEWQIQGDSLIDGTERSLIFFDRNLSHAGRGEVGGDDLVRAVHSKPRVGIFSGLFTEDVKTADQEVSTSELVGGTLSAVIPVLGKFRAERPADFAEGLRLFLSMQSLHELRSSTVRALKDAFAQATKHLEGLGYYAMLSTAASAGHEGLFENDGLIRVARTQFRRNTELAMRSFGMQDELDWIRYVTERGISGKLPQTDEAKSITRDEQFDSEQHILAAKLPTEIGDIYRLTGQSGKARYYVLLAQACDLMVRSNGKRGSGQEPDTFTLARLVNRKDHLENHPRLIHFGNFRADAPDQQFYADLGDRIYVAPNILDACVLSSDGSSIVIPAPTVDASIPPAWQEKTRALEAWRLSKLAELNQLIAPLPDFASKSEVIDALRQRAFGAVFVDGYATVHIDGPGAISFGVHRVARLVESHAKALLIRLSQYQARPDTPAELTRES